MSLHTDAAAVDAAIDALENSVEALRASTHAADKEYRAAHHGQPDPKNEAIMRSIYAAVFSRGLLGKMRCGAGCGAGQQRALKLADIWKENA